MGDSKNFLRRIRHDLMPLASTADLVREILAEDGSKFKAEINLLKSFIERINAITERIDRETKETIHLKGDNKQ